MFQDLLKFFSFALAVACIASQSASNSLFAEVELLGAGSLLRKYVSLICSHVCDVMPVASALAVHSSKHFSTVAKIITQDVTGDFRRYSRCTSLLLCQHPTR